MMLTNTLKKDLELRAAGALTLNTDVLPGAKQIADIQDVIKDKRNKMYLL